MESSQEKTARLINIDNKNNNNKSAGSIEDKIIIALKQARKNHQDAVSDLIDLTVKKSKKTKGSKELNLTKLQSEAVLIYLTDYYLEDARNKIIVLGSFGLLLGFNKITMMKDRRKNVIKIIGYIGKNSPPDYDEVSELLKQDTNEKKSELKRRINAISKNEDDYYKIIAALLLDELESSEDGFTSIIDKAFDHYLNEEQKLIMPNPDDYLKEYDNELIKDIANMSEHQLIKEEPDDASSVPTDSSLPDKNATLATESTSGSNQNLQEDISNDKREAEVIQETELHETEETVKEADYYYGLKTDKAELLSPDIIVNPCSEGEPVTIEGEIVLYPDSSSESSAKVYVPGRIHIEPVNGITPKVTITIDESASLDSFLDEPEPNVMDYVNDKANQFGKSIRTIIRKKLPMD